MLIEKANTTKSVLDMTGSRRATFTDVTKEQRNVKIF
jgi:hypothetical protein